MTAGKLMMAVQIAFMAGAVVTGFVFEKVFKGTARPVIMIGYALFAIFAVSIMWPAVYKNMTILMTLPMSPGASNIRCAPSSTGRGKGPGGHVWRCRRIAPARPRCRRPWDRRGAFVVVHPGRLPVSVRRATGPGRHRKPGACHRRRHRPRKTCARPPHAGGPGRSRGL